MLSNRPPRLTIPNRILFYQHLDTIKNIEGQIEDIQTNIEKVILNQHQNKEDKDNELLILFSKKEEKEIELQNLKPTKNGDSELKKAMKMIAKSNKGPNEQFPSMGCSIKWF